jgi:hypothetical protein
LSPLLDDMSAQRLALNEESGRMDLTASTFNRSADAGDQEDTASAPAEEAPSITVASAVDLDEADAAEGFELPGADLSGEELTVGGGADAGRRVPVLAVLPRPTPQPTRRRPRRRRRRRRVRLNHAATKLPHRPGPAS